MAPEAAFASDARESIGIRLVAAAGRRGEIGMKGKLLFRLKADMAYFRAITAAKPVIMGRKTWDSLPKRPLPGRPNIVVTRNPDFVHPDCFVFSSLPPACAAARAMAARMGAAEAACIGGGEIYAAALPFATDISLTEVDAEAEADSFFPAFDPRDWREVSATPHAADADNEASFIIRELTRR